MSLNKMSHRTARLIILVFVFVLIYASCGTRVPEHVEDFDGGLIQVSNGVGGLMWVPLFNRVSASDFVSSDFIKSGNDGRVEYIGDAYTVTHGIDVSYYQHDIDWDKVRESGISFAMIRCGYRGSTEGSIYEDEKFRENVAGALDAGIQVGVYFFSQAIDVAEAREEADFVLSLIHGMNITFPVAFDWEYIGMGAQSRTDEIGGTQLTDCALAFCTRIRAFGHEPAVYFYRSLGYYE